MKFFFRSKFAQDLGVIKTKIVPFSKKLFLLSLLVSIARPGFSLFSEHDLELAPAPANRYWKTLLVFFSSAKNAV